MMESAGMGDFERDQLARDLRVSVTRRDALEARVRELSLETSRARRDAEAAQQRADALASELERAAAPVPPAPAPSRDDARVRRLERERRDLLAELIDARRDVEHRTGQLLELRAGRWHRLAGTTWTLRRSRRRLAAFALCLLLALCGLVLIAVEPGLWFAGLALIVLGLGLSLLPARAALREHLEGEERWKARLQAESARVTALGDDGLAATPPAAPAIAPAPAPEPVIERRLVPAPPRPAPLDPGWRMTATRVEPRELRVASVLDEMSHACFAPECDLAPVGRSTWREELEARPPHLLLVESAWNGNGGAWQWAVASYPSGPEVGLPSLRAMVAWCRERDIPTVFWNKEDPVHFERFREAAALFDHVFTTDADRIADYEAIGSAVVKTILPLPFAAQPRLHNPVGALGARDGRPAFAGTYYRTRHEDRRADLEMLLDVARPFGLVIYDRTHGAEGDEFGFPERFRTHIRGRLSYAETLAAYRRHSVFLNVNSVVGSPTMCSRRIFELLACGTPVVSTPARAITALLGDAVTIVASPEEATGALERLLSDDAQRRAMSERGRRAVLGTHTYAERLWTILATAGFDLPDRRKPDVTALAVTNGGAAFARVAEAIASQRLTPDEVIVGAPADAEVEGALTTLRHGTRVRLVHQDRAGDASARTRELATMASTAWVAPFAEDRPYDAGHLEGLMACTEFGDAEVVGGEAPSGGAHTFVDALDPAMAIARRDEVARWGWPQAADGLGAWFRRGARLYLAEPRGARAGAQGAGEPPARRAP
jgi:hypothetical protein